jgi:outer membrane murein-binding lipoprotein Lpp
MSNKMLLALFVVGAVVVGGVALRNKTSEVAPVVTEETAVLVDEIAPETESTVEAVVTDVETEAPAENEVAQ